MKTLVDFINEELRNTDDIKWKVDSWMSRRPEEKQAFDAALKTWKETHQLDNELIDDFCNKTNVASFINFIIDDVRGVNSHDNDFEVVKNIIKLYN